MSTDKSGVCPPDDRIAVTVTLRSVTNADVVVLATDYNDEYDTLSAVGQNKTLTGFGTYGEVTAAVVSCGSRRVVDVHHVSRPECSS